MRKTLLIVFIHGFKGGNDTFGNFPKHVRVLLGRALPNISVATAVYPKYETRGSLQDCVNVFREWLQNQVIDLEVSNRTPSPTVDPSVHVFLVGHSMGGIVAAETLLLLASEKPIPATQSRSDISSAEDSNVVEPGSFMFPHVQGVFAFDTPFLGIAPGVVSYGAEGHYKSIASTYNALSEVAGLFGFRGNNSPVSNKEATTPPADVNKALPSSADSDAAATPSWQRWGRYAMFAGAAGAVAAGGAAAMYSQRERLTDSFGWVSSHLAFVGCLARSSELRQRLAQLCQVQKDQGIRCVNFYTLLGKSAPPFVETNSTNYANEAAGSSFSSRVIRSKYRTFCALPAQEDGQEKPNAVGPGLEWIKAVNDKATDEIQAHTCMFLPTQNPAFYELINNACAAMARSVNRGWYTTATGHVVDNDNNNTDMPWTQGQTEGGPMDKDDDVVVVD